MFMVFQQNSATKCLPQSAETLNIISEML